MLTQNVQEYHKYIYIYIYILWEGRIFPQSSEMAFSLNSQGFAQSHVKKRRLTLMPYKPLA